jgi:hypothetical protein
MRHHRNHRPIKIRLPKPRSANPDSRDQRDGQELGVTRPPRYACHGGGVTMKRGRPQADVVGITLHSRLSATRHMTATYKNRMGAEWTSIACSMRVVKPGASLTVACKPSARFLILRAAGIAGPTTARRQRQRATAPHRRPCALQTWALPWRPWTESLMGGALTGSVLGSWDRRKSPPAPKANGAEGITRAPRAGETTAQQIRYRLRNGRARRELPAARPAHHPNGAMTISRANSYSIRQRPRSRAPARVPGSSWR